ncbi:MAG: 3',5'-cyclic-nucleotide phosphodiesterase [Planctomycetia bacterium]|nr:3',5'-cyclic-nucleotide phosphodiesterase [Planctomycetia bacterium]
MRVELLPSSLPVSDAQFLVTYLVNNTVAIDAGSLGLVADLRRQQSVRQVFITHEHLDHIATLPLFLENVYDPGPDCVEVLASASVLRFLHDDIFNGRVWPDFFRLSQPEDAFVQATVLEPMVPVWRAGLSVTPVPVSHCVETMGMVVDDGTAAVAFPSDTGPTEALWRFLAGVPRLRAVFLEASFPASRADLATVTGHHCTTTFAAEITRVGRDVRWIVVHRKPRYAAQIARELDELGLPGVELVRPGHTYEF